ncbi:Protein of unknown function [Gryllus bimaculatus]|nr:Protein of unknown function [Gryllus bimaculatus]
MLSSRSSLLELLSPELGGESKSGSPHESSESTRRELCECTGTSNIFV